MEPAEKKPVLRGEANSCVTAELTQRLGSLPGLDQVRAAAVGVGFDRAWLVGGTIRDAARGCCPDPLDLDLALPGDGAAVARALASALNGSAFPLDEARGAWRVVAHKPASVDLVPLRAETIEADLRGRDLTVNAVAFDLLGSRGLVDPWGGLEDLARQRARLCSPTALTQDPVRVLRVYRFAADLDLKLSRTVVRKLGEAATNLGMMARERVRGELFAALDTGRGGWVLRSMAEHGVLAQLFPEFAGWHGFDQGDYHAHDLAEHALVTAEVVADLAWHAGKFHFLAPAEPLERHLVGELEAGIHRRSLLVLLAFLHDLAKPDTACWDGARRRFIGHEARGGVAVYRLLRGLRLGRRVAQLGQRVVAAHLRLFQLAHQHPATDRAQLRYFKDLGDAVPEALLLSLADERATGPEPPAWPAVSATAGELLQRHWQRRSAQPMRPLLRGRDLLDLGVPSGPRIGEILRAVETGERDGKVTNRRQALDLARTMATLLLGSRLSPELDSSSTDTPVEPET